MNAFFASLVIFCSFMLGWVCANTEIATECQRQGGFYVGQKDFVCQLEITQQRQGEGE